MLEPKVEDLKTAVEQNTHAILELIAAIKDGLPTHAAPIAAAVTCAANAENHEAANRAAPAKKDAPAAAAPTPPAAPPIKPVDQNTSPDYKQAAQVITNLVRQKGCDVAKAVLAKFGAAKLTEVKPEKFAAVIAECQAVAS